MRRRDTSDVSRSELLALLRAERAEVECATLQRVVRARAQCNIDRLEHRLEEIEHGEGLLR